MPATRAITVMLLAIAVAACGEEDEPARERVAARTATPTATAAATPAAVNTYHQRRGCFAAGTVPAGKLRFCRRNGAYGKLRTSAGPLRVERPRGLGGWVWAAASPDGRTILIQWSGECEIPRAFFVPATGGRPRPAAGDDSSKGLGWTTDGRAIVFVPDQPGCGSGEDAGLFLVSPDGKRQRVGEPARLAPFRARVRPVSPDAVSR